MQNATEYIIKEIYFIMEWKMYLIQRRLSIDVSRVILKSRLTTLQMVNSKCIFVFMHFWARFVSTIFHLPTTRMHEQSALPGFVQHMH